jgi:hypothetical protein
MSEIRTVSRFAARLPAKATQLLECRTVPAWSVACSYSGLWLR